jgi:hypothetical protein
MARSVATVSAGSVQLLGPIPGCRELVPAAPDAGQQLGPEG